MVSYGYDPSGRIKTLSWNAGGKADSATYEYIENSHLLSSMKTGSGLTTSYTYEDQRNVKTAVSNSFGNTAVSTYTYEYDELGRRKSVKNSGSAFASATFNIYGYNDRSEVTAANSFTGEDLANKNNPLSDRSRAYNYDPIGNRKTATEAASNLTYTANSLNQYESISGGANPETPAYDADGNMTVAKGMILSYNAENRLIESAPQNPQQGSVKSIYIYDYMGRRARKTLYTYSSGSWQKQKDISFIYDGWNMVKESEKTSDSSPEVPVYYVWGLDLSQSMQGAGGVGGLIASVKSANEYLYTYDANGNVGQMVKASDGSITARYEYDPFGKTIFAEGPMASENPYRFSTKYLDDETGLYYYGFRYYSVELGRWINRDPMGEAGGLNLYTFAFNSGNDVDYLGLSCNLQSVVITAVKGAAVGFLKTLAVKKIITTGVKVAASQVAPVVGQVAGAAMTAWEVYSLGNTAYSVYVNAEAIKENLREFYDDPDVVRWIECLSDEDCQRLAEMLGEMVGSFIANRDEIRTGIQNVKAVISNYAAKGKRLSASEAKAAVHDVGELVEDVSKSLATSADDAVFWSGIRNGDTAASKWVSQNGGSTLETTLANRGIKLPAWDASNPSSVAAWRQASKDFASGASGNVRVLQSDAVRIKSVWAEVEFPALKANPNVTSIRAVNPETGVETLLWSR